MDLKLYSLANYFVDQINAYNHEKPLREKIFLTSKRLNKLIYLFDLIYMQKHNGQSFFEQDFSAWPSGMAINDIYREYMRFDDISEDLMRIECIWREPIRELDFDEMIIADKILRFTKKIGTGALCDVSKLGPWQNYFDSNNPHRSNTVPKKLIYEFFKKKNIYAEIQQCVDGTKIDFE